jgi:surface polysaccharide O-acyltransferase-like enzyme
MSSAPSGLPAPRDLRLDLLRVVAIVVVIWLHVSGEVVVAEPGPRDPEWWVGNVADAFSRWCVPLFVMASGALLLQQRSDLAPLEFYRRRAARVALPTLVWTLVYLAVRYIDDGASAPSLVISVVRGTPYYHLWFLYMIVGLYVVAPIISRLRSTSPPGFMLAVIVLAFLIASAESLVANVADGERAYTFLAMWPSYLGYFLVGDYLWRLPDIPVKRAVALGLAIACAIATALLAAALYPSFGGRSWQIAYANLQPLVILMSLAIFVFVRGLATTFPSTVAQRIASWVPLVLGIYVVHPLWLMALKEIGIDAYLIHPAIGIPVTTALAFALSLASAQVVAAIPVLRRAI